MGIKIYRNIYWALVGRLYKDPMLIKLQCHRKAEFGEAEPIRNTAGLCLCTTPAMLGSKPAQINQSVCISVNDPSRLAGPGLARGLPAVTKPLLSLGIDSIKSAAVSLADKQNSGEGRNFSSTFKVHKTNQ